MDTDRVPIAQFIKAHRITMSCEWADRNPNMSNSRNMDHWKCTLKRAGRRMTVPFSQGFGHNGKEPRIESVLSCMASDSASIDNACYEDWCRNLGYDTDSRTAERTYKACEHQSARLKRFLGDRLYRDLLWDTEGY